MENPEISVFNDHEGDEVLPDGRLDIGVRTFSEEQRDHKTKLREFFRRSESDRKRIRLMPDGPDKQEAIKQRLDEIEDLRRRTERIQKLRDDPAEKEEDLRKLRFERDGLREVVPVTSSASRGIAGAGPDSDLSPIPSPPKGADQITDGVRSSVSAAQKRIGNIRELYGEKAANQMQEFLGEIEKEPHLGENKDYLEAMKNTLMETHGVRKGLNIYNQFYRHLKKRTPQGEQGRPTEDFGISTSMTEDTKRAIREEFIDLENVEKFHGRQSMLKYKGFLKNLSDRPELFQSKEFRDTMREAVGEKLYQKLKQRVLNQIERTDDTYFKSKFRGKDARKILENIDDPDRPELIELLRKNGFYEL